MHWFEMWRVLKRRDERPPSGELRMAMTLIVMVLREKVPQTPILISRAFFRRMYLLMRLTRKRVRFSFRIDGFPAGTAELAEVAVD